ncbi:hypothetical protein TTHERM_00687260, partial (macronuclear) [Tetrahymena thermophila SB210]
YWYFINNLQKQRIIKQNLKMSLRTDDIEGARPKYFEKQKLIAKAQQYNNNSNIFSPPNINQQNMLMRNPDIYSSQVLNQIQQPPQQPSLQQLDQGNIINNVQGSEKSMYQIEYGNQNPSILQNRVSQDYSRNAGRNPIYHYSQDQGYGKMMSEKQYQEQLVIREMKKFKEQQQIIEQDKRRKELELRELELQRKQREQEQLQIYQQQQEENMRQLRQQEQERRQQEIENQLKKQEEMRLHDQMLQEKERQIKEKEMQIQQQQQQRKSANVNQMSINSQELPNNLYSQDDILANQQNQMSQPRIPSSSQNNPQLPSNQYGDANYPDIRKTPVVSKNQQINSSSPPANAKYFNTPLPSQYQQINADSMENQVNQIQQQPSKVSQLAAKQILSPMSALLKHSNEVPDQIKQQARQKQKPTRILAIIDSDSKMREQVNKFFNVRGVYEFEIFSLPGSGAGLLYDKGWRDTFMSCFSFMRQQYDFTDIYIFSSIESAMVPFWYEQNSSSSQSLDKILLKNYHIDVLKQSVGILQQNVSQAIRVSSFLFDNRGGSEKIL